MSREFETGLSTHAANDMAVAVVNTGNVYKACRDYGLLQYGLSFDEDELAEATQYVIDQWAQE